MVKGDSTICKATVIATSCCETEIVLGSPDEASDPLVPYKLRRTVFSAPPGDCLPNPTLTRTASLRRRQSSPHYGEHEDDYYEEEDCVVTPSASDDARPSTNNRRRGSYICKRVLGFGICFLIGIGVVAMYLSTASSKTQKRVEIARLQTPDLPDLLADDPEDAEDASTTRGFHKTTSTLATEMPAEEEEETFEGGQSMLDSSPALAAILQPILDGEATFTPTSIPTDSPTYSPTLDAITHFYVLSDTPYDDDERQNSLPERIAEVSGDPSADFLVHVGGVVDRCEEYAYREASVVLAESEVPVFVLPGKHDIEGCANVTQGRENWREHFYKFDEKNWGDSGFLMMRWGELEENFSFLHRGVLYFGVNIGTNGEVARHRENLERIREILAYQRFDVMVLFAGAEQKGHNDDFFRDTEESADGLYSILSQVHKPIIHFHGGWFEYSEQTGEELGLPNYLSISLEGGVARPISVEVDVFRTSPIALNRGWRSEPSDCCNSGWPPAELLR